MTGRSETTRRLAIREPRQSGVDRVGSVLREQAAGAYVNVLTERDSNRVAEAYGSQYARLATVKRKYDPSNVFRLNANIIPAQ